MKSSRSPWFVSKVVRLRVFVRPSARSSRSYRLLAPVLLASFYLFPGVVQ